MPDAPTYKKVVFIRLRIAKAYFKIEDFNKHKQRGEHLRKQITLNTNWNKNTIFVRFYYSFVSSIKNINYKINFR
jgi:hypothetical protein